MSFEFTSRVMQRIPDMVAYLDTELRYRYTNRAYQQALHLSAEELLGKTVFEVLPENVVSLARHRWQEALEGKEVSYDTYISIDGGPIMWLYVRLMPEFHDDGRVAGMFAIVTDVTDRKNIEIRLQRLRALTDDLPSIMAHCDAQERYVYVNRAYASTHDRTPENIVGCQVRDVVPAEFYERIKPHLESMLRGEAIEFEVALPRADGKRPWMVVRGIPERSGSEVVGFFISATDISKHRELEKLRREFAKSTVQAQEAERKALAQELHDGIAQELAALAVLSNMLERKETSEQSRSILGMLQDGLQRTVNETRRLSYGLHPLELHERGLIKALEELLNRTRRVHSDVNIHFEHDNLLDEVPGSAETCIAVYRIVQESLGNALRHAAPSRVHLSLQCDGDLVRGTIEDDGRGFDAHAPHTGLGLASMKDRALLLGGNLQISSTSEGTCVEFTLPTVPMSRLET